MLNRSICHARYFPTVVKTDSASFNELLDFAGSSLQAAYGHLLIQASYSQSDQFSIHRSRQAQRSSPVSSELWYCICLVLGSKPFAALVFRALGLSTTDYGIILRMQLLGYFAISEGKRFSQKTSRASSGRAVVNSITFTTHPPRIAAVRVLNRKPSLKY